MCVLHHGQEVNFLRLTPFNGKLTGISGMNVNGTILKKTNGSVIVYFCLCKYR